MEVLIEWYIFAVFILSSFLQTTTGFGYAIITAPLLALVLDPKDTVMITMLTGLIIRLMMIKTTHHDGSFKAISPFLITSILGAMLGAYCLRVINVDLLKLFMGGILLIFTFLLWKNYHVTIRHHTFAKAIAGGLSGFLATTTSLNGPPIILYYLNAKAEEHARVLRGNLTRYFLLINLVSIILSYIAGTLKLQELWVILLFSIPALAIGFYLGGKLFHRINAEIFKKIALGMVVVSSVVLIFKAVS